jgi:hypothetical protein
MHAEDTQTDPGSRHGSSLPTGDSRSTIAETRSAGTVPRVPLWLLTLGAGLVSGVVAGLVGEVTGKVILPNTQAYLPPDFATMGGYQKNAVHSEALGKAERMAEQKKSAAAYGVLGALLGLTLSSTGHLAARSPRSRLVVAALGGGVGAVTGAALSFALVPMFYWYQSPESSGLIVLFLTHAGIFAGVGAAAGLALGLGLGERRAIGPASFGGLVGALVGTFVFEASNSLAFPLLRTFEPIPTEAVPRILAHLCVAVGSALVAGLAVEMRAKSEPSLPAR